MQSFEVTNLLNMQLIQANSLAKNPHKAGLLMRTRTFRKENYCLAGNFRNAKGDAAHNETQAITEMRADITTGLEVFLTDGPLVARKVLAV